MTIDDKHLERRARAEAASLYPTTEERLRELGMRENFIWDACTEQAARRGVHFSATLHHLRIHLKTLKALEGLDHGAGCAMYDDLVQSTGMECTCGRDEHIALLRKEVGVTS
jgi:hypothetical protein